MAAQADQPIHLAARRGDLSEVQSLVTNNPALIDLRGEEDNTPLLAAALAGHAAIVKWLIDYGGANVEALDSDRGNGLYLSSRGGHLEVVSILLNRGADIEKEDRWDHRSLMTAAACGHVGVVKLLLSQKSIDLNAQDGRGEIALWSASDWRHEKVVRLLLEAGADPRIADDNGRTPLGMASFRGYGGCIRLLEAALAEPQRARLLHRARAFNDAHHAINKAMGETEGMDEEERKRKVLAAAPAYLKRRVTEGKELPQVEVMMMQRRTEEQEKLAAVVERMVMDGLIPSEVFVELMEMMIPKWDDERSRV